MKKEDKFTLEYKKKLWSVLFCFLLVVLVVSVGGLGMTLWRSRAENDKFRKLAAMVETEIQSSENAADADAADADAAGAQDEDGASDAENSRYRQLARLNPDFIGWLSIEGTKIDYPVMSTPEDPQYYIHRDFDKADSISGTPFFSENSTVDSQSILIYGHNMKNDTMFGALDEYAARSYRNEHPIIEFHTLDEERSYEVFAAFRTRLLYDSEKGFRYYQYDGDLTEEEFDEFMEQVRRLACYDTGIVPEYGDELLMLSTCSYHTDNGRFVVVARRKKP